MSIARRSPSTLWIKDLYVESAEAHENVNYFQNP